MGTVLIDAGVSLTDTQNWLGHDLPTTTAKFYVQRTDASIERAADALNEVMHIRAQSCTTESINVV